MTTSVPPKVPDALRVTSLVAGDSATCALMSNSGVRCWGDNYYGQLGEVTRLRTTPVHVLGTCE